MLICFSCVFFFLRHASFRPDIAWLIIYIALTPISDVAIIIGDQLVLCIVDGTTNEN